MIIGIDEVGRGCWAGPLVAAAVGLNFTSQLEGLEDSKVLSEKQRQRLDQVIRSKTDQIGVGWVSSLEINQLGLTASVRLAMQRAIAQLKIQSDDEIIIDGHINYLSNFIYKVLPRKVEALIKADSLVPAVSAASITAKVARDNYMRKIAFQYPGYGFERHVGYGTKFHLEALLKNGVTNQHRLNYKPIKALVG